jgi:transposase
MGLYCGVDLHSNNHVVTVIDEGDHRLYEKRHPNELASTLGVLERFRGELVGVAVESTFNWYWLVDGLMDAGFPVQLVNTTAVQQYSGLKHSDDWHDAFWLAHLMRLGILPTGYIYPKAQRGIRDLARQRMRLVQHRSSHIVSVQNQIWRSSAVRLDARTIRGDRPSIEWPTLSDRYATMSVEATRAVIDTLGEQIEQARAHAALAGETYPDAPAAEYRRRHRSGAGAGDLTGDRRHRPVPGRRGLRFLLSLSRQQEDEQQQEKG